MRPEGQMSNCRLLLLLLLLCGCSPWIFARKSAFQFTAPVYNLTIEENGRGKDEYAVFSSPIRIGISVPDECNGTSFKIFKVDVEILFEAEMRIVGNFAFLRLKRRLDVVLNRELRDTYTYLIKAKCEKKKDDFDAKVKTLEAEATVNILVTDANDAHPIFNSETYSASVFENIEPLTDILQVNASDADIGYNQQLYYSITSGSTAFTVDPVTGWIRNLRTLSPGTYSLHLLAEDRASRLSPGKTEANRMFAMLTVSRARATINVLKSEISLPKLVIKRRLVYGSLMNVTQTVAIICGEAPNEQLELQLFKNEYSQFFSLREDRKANFWLLETVPGRSPEQGWQATVLARTKDGSSKYENATITVNVDETRSLRFPVSVFRFAVNESSPLGFVIGKVNAIIKNGYKTDYRKLRYTIATENTSVPFWLDECSGYLRVREWLDFETEFSYKFGVEAKLNDFDVMAKAEIIVDVKDSNDHSPIFAAKWIRGEPVAINENFPLNKTIVKIEALDSDRGENGRVQYMLTGVRNTPFVINLTTGEIMLSRPLPPNVSSWQLKVEAFDSGWPLRRSSQVLVTVYKSGTKLPKRFWSSGNSDSSNKNKPFFLNLPRNLIVKEDEETGKIVTTLSATDADSGYAGMVRFGSQDRYFAAHPFTGALFVLNSLRELFLTEKGKTFAVDYEVQLTVYDMGDPVESSAETLKITVEACNSHAPEFEKLFYQTRLREDAVVGTEILIVKAFDHDVGENGMVAYRLEDDNAYVGIDSKSGILTLLKPLDRELIEQHWVTVIAYDHAKPPKLGFANVTIIVEDVNDNAPKCRMQTQIIQFPEDYPNGALLACITSADPDSGENGRINYELYPSEHDGNRPFQIQADTGCLFLKTETPLDYETRTFYNLSIKVSDNGEPQLSSFCNVVAQLIDVNENVQPPKFSDFVYEFLVKEDVRPGTVIGTLEANDPENLRDEKVKYTIADGDGVGYFSIDLEGVLRTTAVLDYEVANRYWLVIKAEDSAAVPLSSFVHVLINVMDVNDHVPMPLQPIYFATVLENSPPRTVFIQVSAEDKDELAKHKYGLTEQSGLTYSIIGGNTQSFFEIDREKGYISTAEKRLLDREKQKEHSLTVKICDRDSSPLCMTVPVIISVLDVNDNAPSFGSERLKYEVQANVLGVLCRVFATDLDAGVNAVLNYSINGDRRFSIDEYGHIIVSEGLKRDELVSLVVRVSEVVMPYSTASVAVTLNAIGTSTFDQKANRKPRLVSMKQLSVSDADPVGKRVGQLEAVDPDGDKLWWSIVYGNIDNTFSLRNDTGVLFLAKSLDSMDPKVQSFTLKFLVSDGSEMIFDELTIIILRSIATRPSFTATHYKTQISERTAVGTMIYTLRATLAGRKKISKQAVTYSITSVDSVRAKNKTRIDPISGNVFLTAPVDREVSRQFCLIICAASKRSVNYAILNISLTDERHTAPKFLQKEYFIRVFAKSEIGSLVTTVRAYDEDLSRNGLIAYSIIAGNENEYFTVDEITGEITIAKRLPTSEAMDVVLTVRASGKSDLPLSDWCTVRIQSKFDEIWLSPFQRSMYSVSVPKSAPVGTVLTAVTLESATAGIRYHLDKSCDKCAIHKFTGVVYLQKALLNEEELTVLRCSISAKNAFGEEVHTTLLVKVTNFNQYPPVFSETVYEGFIEERKPAGSVVLAYGSIPLTVHADDQDSGLNGVVNYRIVSPLEPYFTVDFVTGVVRTKTEIDFEKMKKWSFYVQANDMGTNSLSSTVRAYVTVAVGDVNDVPPVFEHKENFANLLLPTVKGVEVTTLVAHDPDTVGSLRFAFGSDSISDLFTIDSHTGVVSVYASNYSQFTSDNYKTSVLVSDGIHTDIANLTISVTKITQNSYGFRFPQNEYRYSLVENEVSAIAQQLLVLKVVGLEPGDIVSYRIMNPHPEFLIGMGSGQLNWLGGSLDRESSPQIKLLIEASMRGRKIDRAQTVVVVDVEDVNDCAPRFINLPYTVTVRRDVKVGQKIVTVTAVDPDKEENGTVRYALQNEGRYVNINKLDGRIILSRSLRNVASDTLKFTVEATDQGFPNKTTFAIVTVKLVDYMTPIFLQPFYQAEVMENALNGSDVMAVKAQGYPEQQLGYLVEDGDPEKRFALDFSTGFLRVHRQLDRERVSSYNLSIIAVDVSNDAVSARTFALVEVQDINDNAPLFSKAVYRAHVSEIAPPGTEVVKVSAIDPDATTPEVTYSIEGSSGFSINPFDGQIRVISALDYEFQKEYVFTVKVFDKQELSSKVPVVVTVDDINDNPPTIISSSKIVINGDAKENQFLTRVEAFDVDSVASLPGGQRFFFSVIDGDESLIKVRNSSGVITLARNLTNGDLEAGVKKFNISVSDGIYSTYASLDIVFSRKIIDHSELIFEQLFYEQTVKENDQTGKSLVSVAVIGPSRPVKYSLAKSDFGDSWPVDIDELTGNVKTSQICDYEKQSFYRIPLMATDESRKHAFAFLLLHVFNENDNSPRFVSNVYEVNVLRNVHEGETFLTTYAVDDDVNDKIEYMLIAKDEKLKELFWVDPKEGTVTVQKSLQVKDDKIVFSVGATDLANPPHRTETKIHITLLPPNSSLPRFSSTQYVFNTSDGAPLKTVVGNVQTTDHSGLSRAVFLLADDQPPEFPFFIESKTGLISTMNSLKYDEVSVWRFMVRVILEGKEMLGSLAFVTVFVNKSVAKRPLQSSTTVEVSEDAPIGSSIHVITTPIANHVSDAVIVYRIEQGDSSHFFKVDSKTGILSTAGYLDRERQDKHNIIVVAFDGEMVTSNTTVEIIVTDVNDCPPTFERKEYLFPVTDMSEFLENREIGKINVLDKDLPENNRMQLFITEGNEDKRFGIDDKGILYLTRSVGDLISSQINLTIMVFDGEFHATVPVVVDFSSMSPKFVCDDLQYSLHVPEDTAVGKVLLKGLEKVPVGFQFELTQGNPNVFKVEKRGRLALYERLDRERCDQYVLTMQGRGMGTLCIWQVNITVVDVNDEVPVFEEPAYSLTVKENINASTKSRFFLLRFRVEDGDLGSNGEINYGFAEGTDKVIRETFHVHSRIGILSLLKPLDRESRGSYSFKVKAVDGGGMFSTANVSVYVADENDNEPQFERNPYIFELSESETVGYEIGRIRAYDLDEDNLVSYGMESTSIARKYVSINESTGRLQLSAIIDYETINHFSFTAYAIDSGKPPLKSSCLVEINVKNVNDNSPKFGRSIYQTAVPEDSKIGTKVIEVVAVDDDSDEYGKVSYRIVGGECCFAITEDGWILVNGMLDREKQSVYRLHVTAVDGGSPPLESYTEVIVNIKDVNDNPPIISPCNLTVSVQESAEPGSILSKVSVDDDDIPPNAGPFRIGIVGDGAGNFSFDTNFNLVTTTWLSSSQKERYELNMIARDEGGLSSTCPLTVLVKQESLHPPEALPLKIRLNILMNEFLGGKIGVVSANDKDQSDRLTFSIHNEEASKFRILASTGEIFANPGLKAGNYEFLVKVTDDKYTVNTTASVEVYSVSKTALDNAVSILLFDITAEEFLMVYLPRLRKAFESIDGDFRIISLQSTNHRIDRSLRRTRRHKGENVRLRTALDVLFTVANKNGYHNPDRISSFLTNTVEHEHELRVSTKACTLNNDCGQGECVDRLYFEESEFPYFSFNNNVFSAPRHQRTFECICHEGYGGQTCNEKINECSANPCKKYGVGVRERMCVPTDAASRYECVCQPGLSGDSCEKPICEKSFVDCSKDAEISVNGQAFFQISTSSLEETLHVSFKLRTISTDAVVMHGAGNSNYHTIEIERGYLRYIWDCGAGVGSVDASTVPISDGEWHTIEVKRNGHTASLVIDEIHNFTGFSPIGGEVLNLRKDAKRLTFGGEVNFSPLKSSGMVNYSPRIVKGLIGCFGLIKLDSVELPKTKQGLQLYNAQMGCAAFKGNLCLQNPCRNGGICQTYGDHQIKCSCTASYTGQFCEHFLPCLENTCKNNGECVVKGASYLCRCLPGYSGRNCENRGPWLGCDENFCGPFGKCGVESNGSPYCNCTHGYKGRYCNEPPDAIFLGAILLKMGWEYLAIAAGVLFGAVLSVCILCVVVARCCIRGRKRRQSKPPFEAFDYEINNYNPKLTGSFDTAPNTLAPPPLPPPRVRLNTNQLSNYQRAQLTGLPVGEVRPFPVNEHFGSSSVMGSRSPSLVESVRCKSKRMSTPNSQRNLDFTRNCVSSADEVEQSSMALYRFGRKISEEDSEELSSTSSQMRFPGNGRPRHRRSRLKRSNRGGRTALLLHADRIVEEGLGYRSNHPTVSNQVGVSREGVLEHPDDQRRSNVTQIGSNCIAVGETILAPHEDDDYMTMHPANRKLPPKSVESQRRPLLETSDSDGMDESPYIYPDEVNQSHRQKPVPPAHGSRRKVNEGEGGGNRVYDDPTGGKLLLHAKTQASGGGSLKRPLSSPNLSGVFGHIDSENDQHTECNTEAG